MRIEPQTKRTHVFFDGQNLFHCAKLAYGYVYPNYDPFKLAHHVCGQKGWQVDAIHFYTGLHDAAIRPVWHRFWTAKMAGMGTKKIRLIHRPLQYHDKAIMCPDGSTTVAKVGHEKGIDVRIALDVVKGAVDNLYDVALIFSQDHDLSEAVQDVREISALQDRWIRVASAFPDNGCPGIRGTEWIKLDKNTYDSCLDPNTYSLPSSYLV